MCLKYKLIFTLFLFCIFNQCRSQARCGLAIVKRPDSKGHLQMNFSDPKILEKNLKDQIRFSRHHVIPYARIRDFINSLVLPKSSIRNRICFILYDIMNVIMDYSTNNDVFTGINIGNIKNNFVAQLILSTNKEERRNLINNFQDVTKLARHIHRFFAWFPANIFIGPSKRKDDPGEGFETNSSYVIGSDRYEKLYRINDLMISYEKMFGNDDQIKKNQIISEIVGLFKLLLPYSITPFKMSDWEVSDGEKNINGVREKLYSIKFEYTPPYYKNYGLNSHLSDTIIEIRRKRQLNINEGCMYEDVEEFTKKNLGNRCATHLPKCGCF